MRWREILLSIAAPLISWLLLGAPHLNLSGNLALFVVLVAHFYVVIWNDLVFRLFSGDRFTYGAVALTINLISMVTNFVAVWVTLHIAAKHIARVTDISPYSWGVIALSLMATIIFPILTQRNVAPLPRATDRREFEDPTIKGSQERP